MKGLGALDPRAAPLPHGTEVITGVDRVAGERTVPQGTIGRVVGLPEEGLLDVHVVGVGTLRYRREDLTLRKAGQARYATRRADTYEALMPCRVLETVVGSQAWGLADERSDTDLRGAFALPFSWTTGLADPPQDLVREDGSATYWEVGKAIRQALRADPNTLEMLFVPGVKALDPIGAWILEAREAFVSKEIHGTFARYAVAQLRRLEQSQRLARHRADVLEWLREGEPTLDEVAARLADRSPRAAPTRADGILAAKEYIKQLYRSLHDQGLVEAKSFEALGRFARGPAATLELPRELRPKNAYNLLRLVWTASEWLRTGTPTFAPGPPLRDRLLAIKRGEVALEEVLTEAEAMTVTLAEALQESALPAHPDVERADALLRRIRGELARRGLDAVEGPFGRDAPAAPVAAWE